MFPWRHNMDSRIKKVVVVGGGSAGWMSAAYLAKVFEGVVSVTLIEAPGISKIGVGESTIPSLQNGFFERLGLKEFDWMRECNGSFKQGMRFINWRTEGENTKEARPHEGRPDYFYMIFGNVPTVDGVPLSHYWFRKKVLGEDTPPYTHACMTETMCIETARGPMTLDGSTSLPHAWHLDAHLLAEFLCRFSTKNLGVEHILDLIVGADRDERGFITALQTKSGQAIEGDLFIDATGFRAALIRGIMDEPLIPMNEHLLVDRAVAAPLQHDAKVEGVEPSTLGIAMSSGWSWKSPMLGRFGAGYVYCSEFVSDDEAMNDYCKMWDINPNETKVNFLRFSAQKTRKAWVNNCVSVGLAASWTEPMHATGLHLIYHALHLLHNCFPDKSFDPVLIDRFNEHMDQAVYETRDILQLHYYLSPRNDTPFWRANKQTPLSAEARQLLALHKAGLPINQPPVDDPDIYYSSYEFELQNFWPNHFFSSLFSGLDYFPDRVPPALIYKTEETMEKAERLFAKIAQEQRRLHDAMPSTYDLLTHIHSG